MKPRVGYTTVRLVCDEMRISTSKNIKVNLVKHLQAHEETNIK